VKYKEVVRKKFMWTGCRLKQHCFLDGSKASPARPSGSISTKMKKFEEDVKMVTAVA